MNLQDLTPEKANEMCQIIQSDDAADWCYLVAHNEELLVSCIQAALRMKKELDSTTCESE